MGRFQPRRSLRVGNRQKSQVQSSGRTGSESVREQVCTEDGDGTGESGRGHVLLPGTVESKGLCS